MVQPTAQDAANEAVALMIAMQPTAVQMSDAYVQGLNDNMRMQMDMKARDPDYNRFSQEQQAALCGFCGVTSWKAIPKIWKAIENTKPETDLKKIITQEWSPYQGDLNVNFMTWNGPKTYYDASELQTL